MCFWHVQSPSSQFIELNCLFAFKTSKQTVVFPTLKKSKNLKIVNLYALIIILALPGSEVLPTDLQH